eukprot:scaffold56773_cov27-Tisochrysis_lutea.AAC.2
MADLPYENLPPKFPKEIWAGQMRKPGRGQIMVHGALRPPRPVASDRANIFYLIAFMVSDGSFCPV